MELKVYWKWFKRRWWLIVVPAIIVFLFALFTYQPPAPAYNVGVRFIIGQTPTTAATLEDEERLANWQTSEYLVNGITDWVRGMKFAEQVSQKLAGQGFNVPASAIMGSIAADNVRSMMTLSLTYGDASTLEKMMAATIEVLLTQNEQALPQLGGTPAVISQLDNPIVNPISPGIRQQLELGVRLLVGLSAGIALAVLVEYLDPTIHDRDELQKLNLPILGEIPAQYGKKLF